MTKAHIEHHIEYFDDSFDVIVTVVDENGDTVDGAYASFYKEDFGNDKLAEMIAGKLYDIGLEIAEAIKTMEGEQK